MISISKAIIASVGLLTVATAAVISPSSDELGTLNPRALGINCQGSGLCSAAQTFKNTKKLIMQTWYDVVEAAIEDGKGDLEYKAGEKIVCVGASAKLKLDGNIGASYGSVGGTLELPIDTGGGICLFLQHTKETLTLKEILPLVRALGLHKCTSCGSVPIHYVDDHDNDPKWGILTSNYVSSTFCVDNCLTVVGTSSA